MAAISAGDADISASYSGVTGRTHVTIARPVTSTLSGGITDGTSGGVLPNIHVQIADGANAGKSAQTDGAGRYSIGGVAAGTMTVVASATSYQAVQKTVAVAGDTRLDFVLPRIPPPKLAFSTTASQGWTAIDVSVGGRVVGTLRKFFEPGAAASCDAVADARIVATVSTAATTWSARSDSGTSWSGSVTLNDGACYEVQLTCANRNCSGSVSPPPPSPPSPSPTPSPSTGLYVWGGPNYTQYLGFFTCVFCTEFAVDSINNQFGTYGSPFSITSIRNQFSQYGSPFSIYSACNEFAFNPPRVYNANRSIYYGELTLNQFRLDAIKTTGIMNWLIGDVCRH